MEGVSQQQIERDGDAHRGRNFAIFEIKWNKCTGGNHIIR